jgi:outer membrane protein OmpA-like peptidoglycan-associated protein
MPILHKPVLLLLLPLAVLTTHAQQQKTDTLTLHFAFDQSAVRPSDSTLFHQLETLSIDSVLITGHTDTKGSVPYNQQLSWKRALSTQTALRATFPESLSASVRLEGRGKTEPLPGDDSLSRRVVVIVYYHEKPPPIAHIDSTPPPPTLHRAGDPDTTITLDNINFIANTPVLTPEAREAMPHTINNLRRYSDRYLEIDGFCNAPGPPLPPHDPLFILSVHRAKYIYDYLVGAGFDSTHLRYKGLGNATPVNAHPTTAAEMDQNMRVEIKIFSKIPPP